MMQRKSHAWKPPEAMRIAVTETGEMLHMGGEGNTTNIEYAWLGSRAQFLKLDIDHDKYTLKEREQL